MCTAAIAWSSVVYCNTPTSTTLSTKVTWCCLLTSVDLPACAWAQGADWSSLASSVTDVGQAYDPSLVASCNSDSFHNPC